MIIDGNTPLLETFLSLAEAILIMKILFLLWLCNCIKHHQRFPYCLAENEKSLIVLSTMVKKALMSTYCSLTTHWNALPSWQKKKKEWQKPPVHLHSFFLLFISFKTQVSLKKRNSKMEVLNFLFASLTLFCWEDDTKYRRTRDPEVTLKYKAGHLCYPKLTV